MKLIQLARFVATPHSEWGSVTEQEINQPAIIEVAGGLQLRSAAPTDAGKAEKINAAVQQLVRNEEQRGPG